MDDGERRGPYKRYLTEAEKSMPRSTAWRRRRREEDHDHGEAVNEAGAQEAVNEPECHVGDAESSSASEGDARNHSDYEDNRNYISEGGRITDESVGISQSAAASSEEDEHDLGNESGTNDSEPDEEEFYDAADAVHFPQNEDDAYRPEQMERIPLCPECCLTREESELLLMSFIIRWALPDRAIEDLLRVVDCHLPHSMHGSKFLFLKKFPTPPSMTVRFYCPDCAYLFPSNENVLVECEKCHVRWDTHVLKLEGRYFVQLSIQEQLQDIIGSDLYYQLRKQCPSESDVLSGSVYRNLIDSGVIGRDDVTLQWNTDGMKLFNSSKVSAWPIQAQVNELPYRLRREKMIFCGLWVGPKKPVMDMFLKPFVDELSSLHSEGFICHNPEGQQVTIKVHTLICSVDSVARPLLQNIKQFNGEFGCSFCLHAGIRVPRKRGTTRIYPGERGARRTLDQHLADCESVEASGEDAIRGVKGPSILLFLQVFNIISSFVPDYLHSVLIEGVTKTFWENWVGTAHEELPFYLRRKRGVINERLDALKPPVEITRTPRKCADSPQWKASEWRAFLLYYSLLVLKGLLPAVYYNHWFLFVYSMHIFLKENISEIEFQSAKAALEKFVDQIGTLYPDHMYTFNVHLLLHIPSSVKKYGALQASSTVPFEHYNGVLGKLFKGTQGVPLQICRSFLRLRSVSKLSKTLFSQADCSERAKDCYERLLGMYHSNLSLSFGPSLRLFGVPISENLNMAKILSIENLLGVGVHHSAVSYQHFISRCVLFHSKDYAGFIRRNNSIAEMVDGSLISVTQILTVDTITNEKKCVVLGEELEAVQGEDLCTDRQLNIPSGSVFRIVQHSGRIVCKKPEHLRRKCVHVPYGDNDAIFCVIPLVNAVERD